MRAQRSAPVRRAAADPRQRLEYVGKKHLCHGRHQRRPALAGATVRARRLRLCPVAVGATLRIQDSLQEGRSRFYAELLRVKQLVDLANGPLPLLFLLDEIFAGTNSHDRRVGAEAVVHGLVEPAHSA